MRLVVLESPFAGDEAGNVRFAQECVLDCLRRGESPIASHLLFPQVLVDSIPEERALGMRAGHEWTRGCDAVVVYVNKGISVGMLHGVTQAEVYGKPVEYRELSR